MLNPVKAKLINLMKENLDYELPPIPEIFFDPRELLIALAEQGLSDNVFILSLAARHILGDSINDLAQWYADSQENQS